MVDKFKKILEDLVRGHGPVFLFAILQMDEFIDKWSVIVSVPWIRDRAAYEATFEEIRNALVSNLSAEELRTIARIGIYDRNEHLIDELIKLGTGKEIKEDQKINGNTVYKGFILEANSQLDQSQAVIPTVLFGKEIK